MCTNAGCLTFDTNEARRWGLQILVAMASSSFTFSSRSRVPSRLARTFLLVWRCWSFHLRLNSLVSDCQIRVPFGLSHSSHSHSLSLISSDQPNRTRNEFDWERKVKLRPTSKL